jgi:eukaryotic-like serine/threonine-protein kinase
VIGTTVGSYRILSKVSTGGMGTVYRAEHTLIGKAAAVKVLNAELCTNEDVVNRFLNEAKATTTIKHPGIVEVFDYGYMESGHAFLVMEFLEGMTLAKRCKMRGKIPEGEAAMLLRGVCSALSAAHAKGIIHRDLKPDNVFLAEDPDAPTGERPKLLDFGIAKLTEIGLAGATKEGAVMGTPTYMSPEQCRGTGEVDLRADLYSIGCMYYELVTGRPPFVGLGAGELIGAHLFVDPEPPRMHAPELSVETEQLIMSLIEKDPDNRPQTTRELAVQLTVIAQHQGWVTQTNPTGISSPSLPILRPPPPLPTELDRKPRPSPRAATDLPEKPTTLSGAASSIIDVPRRSRRGLGIALAAAVFLASASVAFIQLRKSGDDPTPTPAIAPSAVKTPPSPPVVVPKPVEPPKPAVVTETVKPVETAKPVEPPPKPAIAAVKPTNPVQKPAKLPVKPPVTKPTVTKPTKPTLIETDI